MNSIAVTGRLGNDPEVKYTQSQKAVCHFSLADNVGFGKYKTTNWYQCEAWGKTGEAIKEYVSKGHELSIIGELKIEEWKDDNGKEHRVVKITVNRCQFIGGKPNDEGSAKSPAPTAKEDDGSPF